MARGLAKLGLEKGLDQFPHHFRAFNPSAHANHIEIVILNSLPGGKIILNQAGANSFDFVGTNAGANTTAANGHTPIHFPGGHRLAEWNDEVGIIIVLI